MYWQKQFQQEDPNLALKAVIDEIRNVHPNYGYRRILAMLRNRGIVVNKKKLQRIIQKFKLQVRSYARKSRKYSSYRGVKGHIEKNRIRRRFGSTKPHQKITTDTTEFKYYELDEGGVIRIRKLYLNPFLDLYNCEIISYSISPTPSAESILAAQKKAIEVTADAQFRRTFHSDRGWGYQMRAYQHALKANNIFQSMSRKGNCYDNAPMETFFGILKQEIYYGKTYHSYQELADAIIQFIEYYNVNRIKEKLGWQSPIAYQLANQTA